MNIYFPTFTTAFYTVALLFLFLFFLFGKFLKRNYWIINGLIFTLFAFCFGMYRTTQHADVFKEKHFGKYIDSSSTCIAEVLEPISEKQNSVKVTVGVKGVLFQNHWVTTDGILLVYIKKDTNAMGLQRGDHLIFNSKIEEVQGPMNPEEFNYKRYLFRKNIYYQSFVRNQHWNILKKRETVSLLNVADQARDKLLDILKRNQVNGDEFAVISALLLGYQDKIDPETLKNFSGAGIVHILSVSGLHVGIIFLVLSFLLKSLNKVKHGSRIKFVIIISFIWFYTLITGMAPCVLRASLMFSIMLTVEIFYRKATIYQSIILSMSILLVINPFFLYDTGFELSYLAVLGIVIFQKSIASIYIPKNKIMKMGWDLISVSIAAQLATIPLTLFYFHQFPVYFIIANLIAIPLTNLLMLLAILVMVFSPINIISSYLGWVLSKSLYGFNKLIEYINLLPYSSIQHIHFDGFDAVLISIILILLSFLILKKKSSIYIALCFFVCSFILKQAVEKASICTQRKISVYCIKNHTVLAFTFGNQCIVYADSSVNEKSNVWIQHIANHMTKERVSNIKFTSDSGNCGYYENQFFCSMGNCFQFFDKRILVLDSNLSRKQFSKYLHPDIMVVTQKASSNIEKHILGYSPKLVVLDATLSKYSSKKWSEVCQNLNVKCCDIKQSGALLIDLP